MESINKIISTDYHRDIILLYICHKFWYFCALKSGENEKEIMKFRTLRSLNFTKIILSDPLVIIVIYLVKLIQINFHYIWFDLISDVQAPGN